MINKRTLSFLSCLLLSAFFLTTKAYSVEKPNIILILADDLGYGDLSCYDGVHSTPHLDRMAVEGLRFTDFHSTASVCSPTRASIMTGRYPHYDGLDTYISPVPGNTIGLDPENVTFPGLITDVGYKTALFGKWHLGYEPKHNPLNYGFEIFHGFLSGHVDYHSHYDRLGGFDWWHGREQKQEEGYTTHLITDKSVDFIKENADHPFFLMVAHEGVHFPLQGPTDPIQRGPDAKPHKPRNGKLVYKDMLQELDISVGKIMDVVKELNLERRTLIFFTSDNGPMPFSKAGPLKGKKHSVYEGGHRVPTIAWWPETIKAGSVTDQLAITMDLMPSILELAGSPVPEDHPIDAVSLVDFFKNQEPFDRQSLFWRRAGKQADRAMREGQWSLVIDKTDRVELYDLKADIGQQKNVAEMNPERSSTMKKELLAWEDKVKPYLNYLNYLNYLKKQ
jgi:arylsulfatase A-like enzyme